MTEVVAETGTTPKLRTERSPRGLGLLFTLAGLLGLIASTALLVEKLALTENPDYIPTCTLSPVLSCGSVMTTPHAEAFGIPNPILGIAGFAATTALGTALLAGARYSIWFWWIIQAGMTFAVVFIHWLIYQSLYTIGALCPYCMVVWVVTIPLFWHTTIRNIRTLRTVSRPLSRRFLEVKRPGFDGDLFYWISTSWLAPVVSA